MSGTAPASAVAYPGINGKLVCGGTLPTPTPNVSDFEVYTLNPDRSERTEQTRLTNNPANDAWPRWSPDGTRIVFQSNRRANNNDIWVMDSFGGNLVT